MRLNNTLFFLLATFAFCAAPCTVCTSCKRQADTAIEKEAEQQRKEMQRLLYDEKQTPEIHFAIVKIIADDYMSQKDYNKTILFLTDWVEHHPKDIYNTYWLLMTAYVYMRQNAYPVAAYYFDRILQNYDDLLIEGQSVHFLCLKQLVRFNTNPTDRIKYFNELINRFPSKVSIAELYAHIAREYENLGEWNQALKAYSLFLSQPDAATVQIADMPDAYSAAQQFVDFNKSPEYKTFESLDALEAAIKSAIAEYNWKKLDEYKSKANFFIMNFEQDTNNKNDQKGFSMRSYMRGNAIHFSAQLDETSNPNEAYLRTWGWNPYVSVWYFYFRKINFPINPEIHGRWEWAGIYFGEKM